MSTSELEKAPNPAREWWGDGQTDMVVVNWLGLLVTGPSTPQWPGLAVVGGMVIAVSQWPGLAVVGGMVIAMSLWPGLAVVGRMVIAVSQWPGLAVVGGMVIALSQWSPLFSLFCYEFDAPLAKNDWEFMSCTLCLKAETIRKWEMNGHKMKTLSLLHVRCTLAIRYLYFTWYCTWG